MPVIDFPNSPTNGDELQAPNKFVYRWVDDNRWKNIHRPLVIPDYIWPDLSDPDDPWGDGSTPPGDSDPWPNGPDDPIDGGGGDDWVLEALDFPVGVDEANITIDFVVNEDVSGVSIKRTSDFTVGASAGTASGFSDREGIAKAPLIAHQGQLNTDSDDYYGMDDFDADTGNTITSNPGNQVLTCKQESTLDYQANYPTSWVNLSEVLSANGYANKTSAQFRILATGMNIGWTFGGVIFDIAISERNSVGSNFPGEQSSSIDWNDVAGTRNIQYPREGAWKTISADAEYLKLGGRCDAGMQIGNISLEIKDPYGPAVPDKPPVAFCCNPEMTFSIMSFSDTDPGDTFGVLRAYEHRNPGRLDNTVVTDSVNANTIGDITTNITQNRPISSIEMTENGGHLFWIFEDNRREVHKRHLGTPYDITTHSWTDSGANDDFRNYSSYTSNFGYDIKDFKINPDQTKLYTLSDGNLLRDYDITVAGDLSSVNPLSPVTTVDLTAFAPDAMDISQDGFVIILIKTGKVKQLIMDTSWDLSTTFDSGFERDFFLQNPVDICVNSDGSSIMVLDVPNDTSVNAYTLYNYTRNI